MIEIIKFPGQTLHNVKCDAC